MTKAISEQTAVIAAELYANRPPRPPFDPEIAGAVEAMMQALPRLMDVGVEPMRELLTSGALGGAAADLTFSGKIQVVEHQVPGPHGAPDVTVTVYSPVEQAGARRLIVDRLFDVAELRLVSGRRTQTVLIEKRSVGR